MTLTGAIVLFAVTWFMVFFCVLPWRFESQGETGEVVPGTPVSAPSDVQLGRKMRITSMIAVVVWLALVGIIWSGVFTLDMLDVFNIMGKR